MVSVYRPQMHFGRRVCRRLNPGLVLILALSFGIWLVPAVQAQEPIPRIEDAEIVFEQGIEAFEAGDYGMAYRRFRLVFTGYDLNRKTTAAMLMGGKALYRDGEYARAADLLLDLIERYPSSGYVDEARRVREFALERVSGAGGVPEVQGIGIILPLNDNDATLTQALFTGVRIAVDEHNRLNADHPIRMVFRDTESEVGHASEMVSALGDAGVQAIIGPLYSEEALAAAESAERNGIVLIAPLANDEAVSEGKEFVFQANPTITARGRLMARFAVRGLMLDDFGIIAERTSDQISERMAEGFQEEMMLNGEEVHFFKLLDSGRDWGRLSEIVGDTMRLANAVYLPISGGESTARIDAALASLDELGMDGRIRVLGNTEWHEIPSATRASRYEVTYTNDFYVRREDESVRAFVEEFDRIVGQEPDPSETIGRLAFTGYDVARFLIAQMIRDDGNTLQQRLQNAPSYQGLGLRIDFMEGNVNEALYYFRYQDGRTRLLR